jgi:hypothetical protein
MKRAAAVVMVALALSCKDSTKPLDPWAGTWHLVSVDSVAVPADVTINGYETLVVQRTLDVGSKGTGVWTDSTLSASMCGLHPPPSGLCDASGLAEFSWTAVADTLTFVRLTGMYIGYVAAVKTFVKQADGSLLKTDDNQTEVYRR